MGQTHSNTTAFARRDSSGKAQAVPVVLPMSKVHSYSSFTTTDSEGDDQSQTVRPQKEQTPLERVLEEERMFRNLLETYNCGTILGKGTSALVFEVRDRRTGVRYACKMVRRGETINDQRTMTMETEIMKRAEHENVVRLHELYETPNTLWFITELATAGTLQSALSAQASYNEELVADAFKQVLLGVKYLHDMGVVHRDLKQENILCSIQETDSGVRLVPKIVDFGLSALTDVPSSSRKMKSYSKLKPMWGTKEFFAPEVYKQAYGPQVDVWALGCVLYELLVGEAPFPVREKRPSAVDRYMLNGGRKIARAFELRPGWQALSAEALDLIRRMLKINPRKRLSIAECLEHPFITGQLLPQPKPTDQSDATIAAAESEGMEARHQVRVEGQRRGQERARAAAQHRKYFATTYGHELESLIERALS